MASAGLNCVNIDEKHPMAAREGRQQAVLKRIKLNRFLSLRGAA
jgi:hypothetical protein